MTILLILKIFFLGFLYDKLVNTPKNTLNCGLFGYSGSRLPDYNALKLLAIDAEARGRDSTGVYGKGLWKTTDESGEAVYSDEFRDVITSKLVLGHTRYATMGLKNKDNAHPYEFEYFDDNGEVCTIIGSHNGWLIEPEWQAFKNNIKMPAVDSMLIFEKFIKDDFNFHSLLELHGSMALAFTLDKKRLYLYKRRSKPLFIAQTKSGIYYSSRENGLRLAGFRNIIACPNDEILGFEDGTLVDHRFYGTPDITMPCDTSPTKWKDYDYENIIPHSWDIKKELNEDKRSSECKVVKLGDVTDNANQLPFDVKDESLSELKSKKNKTFDHHKFIRKFKESKDLCDIKISSGAIIQEARADGDKSYIIASLEEAGSEEKMSDWNVFLDLEPYDTLTMSSDRGLCIMECRVDEPTKCRIIAIPPDTNEAYYSKLITVSPSSVLEVTLSLLPFQETPEWKEIKREEKHGNNCNLGSEDKYAQTDDYAGDDGDEGYVDAWSRMGQAIGDNSSAKLIENFLGSKPEMVFSYEGSQIAYFKDFERPYVAEAIFQDVFDMDDGSCRDKYNVAMKYIEDLEKGTDEYIGWTQEELDLKLRNKLMTPLLIILDDITDVTNKNVTSKILLVLGERIHSNSWWEVYSDLRDTTMRFIKHDNIIANEVCEKRGLLPAKNNNLSETTSKIEKEWQTSELSSEKISVKGEEVYVDDIDVVRINKSYDLLIMSTFNDFWALGRPQDEEDLRDCLFASRQMNNCLSEIIREVSSFKKSIIKLTGRGYENSKDDVERVDKLLSHLEDVGTNFTLVSNVNEFVFDEHNVDTVKDLWWEANNIVSQAYDVLAECVTEVNNNIPEDKIIPF